MMKSRLFASAAAALLVSTFGVRAAPAPTEVDVQAVAQCMVQHVTDYAFAHPNDGINLLGLQANAPQIAEEGLSVYPNDDTAACMIAVQIFLHFAT